MNSGSNHALPGEKVGKTTRRCSVVAIYEDTGSREWLLELSNTLTERFKREVTFEVDWCRFKYLADPRIAKETAQSATQADLILLAQKSPELPGYVQGWFEGWAPNRESGEGALVLVHPSPKGTSRSLALHSYLRQTAKRANLDYLRLKTSRTQLELEKLLGRDPS
jgi:hypothetical protein